MLILWQAIIQFIIIAFFSDKNVQTQLGVGWRIDGDRKLISIKGNVNDKTKIETLVAPIPNGASSIEIMIEPVVVSVNNVPTLELQLSYDIGATGTFTVGAKLRPDINNNFYAMLPFHPHPSDSH